MSRLNSGSLTVSVVVPAYKAASFIRQAIESVLAQTYGDYEIIVVNDGSPDTPILEEALDLHAARIRYIRQENRGVSGARNTAIRAAAGEFIAFLDGDDKWLPELLESQLGMLSSRARPDFVYADALLFGDSPLAGETVMQRYPSKGAVTFESLLQNRCVVTTSTVVARRSSLMDAGLFNEAYTCCEDFDLWLRLLYKGARFTYQDRVLACHREHTESVTAAPELLLKSQIRVLEQLSLTLELSVQQQELIDSRVARCQARLALRRGTGFLLKGQYEEARRAVGAANKYFRSRKLSLVEYGLRFAPGVVRFALDRRRRKHQAESASD